LAAAERFIHAGVWVLLAGYNDGAGRPLSQVQRVTSEKGNINCAGMTAIPSAGGLQHYVKWNIPTTGYCLNARGTNMPPNTAAAVRDVARLMADRRHSPTCRFRSSAFLRKRGWRSSIEVGEWQRSAPHARPDHAAAETPPPIAAQRSQRETVDPKQRP
jgi:hypothetical protein